MKFDLIIANPPYGIIGTKVTSLIVNKVDFKEYVNLLPINTICRDSELVTHVIDAVSIDRGAFEDAIVTTGLSTLSKNVVNNLSPTELFYSKQTKRTSPLYKYIVANALRNYDRFKEIAHCTFADLNADHLGQKPVDVGFLISYRASAHGHMPYSKTSPQYRWNVLHNLPPEELITIWKAGKDGRTWGDLILLPTKQERDNMAKFIFSKDGFRFLSMQLEAMNSDFALYKHIFPKVDWTRPQTVESILKEYNYTPDEIKEVIENLKNYKYLKDE